MASVLEQIQVKYKGREVVEDSQQTRTTLVYQGSKELCEQWMDANPPKTIDPQYGTIDSIKMSQAEGPFWELTVVYLIDTSTGTPTGSNNSAGPKHSTLSMSMMSMPLESHYKYKCIWNNNLWATKEWSDLNQTQKDAANNIEENAGLIGGIIYDYIRDTQWQYKPASADFVNNVYFAWGKNESDCPILQVKDDNDPQRWYPIKMMIKPGVDHWSYPVYTITEKSKNGSKIQAGWNLSEVAGTISEPKYGDFGLTKALSGNWLCEGR